MPPGQGRLCFWVSTTQPPGLTCLCSGVRFSHGRALPTQRPDFPAPLSLACETPFLKTSGKISFQGVCARNSCASPEQVRVLQTLWLSFTSLLWPQGNSQPCGSALANTCCPG